MSRSGGRVVWNGAALQAKTRGAQVRAVNRVMSESVIHAKQNHAWKNVTGTAEGSIRIASFAAPFGGGVRGTWGSLDVRYFRRLEKGFFGVDSLNREYMQIARPALGNAAAANYPKLPGYVAQEMRK